MRATPHGAERRRGSEVRAHAARIAEWRRWGAHDARARRRFQPPASTLRAGGLLWVTPEELEDLDAAYRTGWADEHERLAGADEPAPAPATGHLARSRRRSA